MKINDLVFLKKSPDLLVPIPTGLVGIIISEIYFVGKFYKVLFRYSKDVSRTVFLEETYMKVIYSK